jgi:beta-lactamase class A
MMRIAVLLGATAICNLAVADPATVSSNASLTDRLAAVAKAAPARVGIYVEHLEKRQSTGVEATRPFPLASTFKLPLAIVALDALAHGKLPPATSLDGKVRLLPEDMLPRHSPLHEKYPRGGEIPLREVLSLLLEESDNSAADGLYRLVGGGARITAALRALGLDGISIDRNEHQLGRAIAGSGEAARASAAAFLKDPRDHASPAAMAAVETKLWRNQVALPPPLATFVKDELTRCQTGPDRLRGGLPAGTPLGHRTGTCPGPTDDTAACANDIGIVTLPSGEHVAIAVMVESPGAPLSALEPTIAAVAKTVWAYYAR